MVMENPFEGKEIWFGVGSQDLYGEEALRQVAIHSAEMVDYLNNTGKIPAKIVLKPTLKSSDGVKEFMVEASANPNVIGVITWCHTFSPAKMWIRGLEVLTKPLLQLATQHHKEIPWETIDMDFMNLNQAAHGDREFGYIVSRLGIKRKVVVGHYTDPEVAEKLGTWARACAGWDASNNMKVMRWGDNMRNVAVTETRPRLSACSAPPSTLGPSTSSSLRTTPSRTTRSRRSSRTTRPSTTSTRLCWTPSTTPCSSPPRKRPRWST